jgi:hypothetical protein
MGARHGFYAMEKRKICYHFRESNPGLAARIPSLYRLNYPGSQTPYIPVK